MTAAMIQNKEIGFVSAGQEAQIKGRCLQFQSLRTGRGQGGEHCDLDLPDYATVYWGINLPQLKQVKMAYDPDNVSRHAQSVPAT
jgi:Berberine and berberine like